MAKTSLAVLEEALRSRKLDRTLTTARPLVGGSAELRTATGISALDESLHGGIPRGQLSELAGAPSSGRTAVLLHMLAAVTRRGEIASLVDTFDRLDIASLVAAGVDLDRLLWIRGHATRNAEPPGASVSRSEFHIPRSDLVDRMVGRALKALNLVLQAGGFGLVAIDLADVPRAVLNRLPFTTWPRLQRTIEGSETACVLVTAQPLARSAGGVTLALSGGSQWAGECNSHSRRLTGLDVTVQLMSPRRRVEGDVHVRCAVRG